MTQWRIFRGTAEPHDGFDRLPPPVDWRSFDGTPIDEPELPWRRQDERRARAFVPDEETLDVVNAALYLRRPLLVTGSPGVGKSTLALAIARELGLGPMLRWPITSRSTLKEGLYTYDAIGRLHDVNLHEQQARSDIGRYLTLGPLGTALLPRRRPRVLLVDEIDKSDIDLPNDLLHIFEEGEFTIPELRRMAAEQPRVEVTTAEGTHRVPVEGGVVRCHAFPVVVLTSNQERDFPAAFLRRCLQLTIAAPGRDRLRQIVRARLGLDMERQAGDLIDTFVERQRSGELAIDQLLNAIFLRFKATERPDDGMDALAGKLMEPLGSVTD
ncbi:MoxR family ATPase [Actinomadura fulvescens]|uniref:MoxR family ATPase n=1 Tax=Actinomadura fulvescens TaxID=46160 RepID=A0ABN3QPX6_9ACTN